MYKYKYKYKYVELENVPCLKRTIWPRADNGRASETNQETLVENDLWKVGDKGYQVSASEHVIFGAVASGTYATNLVGDHAVRNGFDFSRVFVSMEDIPYRPDVLPVIVDPSNALRTEMQSSHRDITRK